MKKIILIVSLLWFYVYGEPINVLVSVVPQKQMLKSIGEENVAVKVLVHLRANHLKSMSQVCSR